MKNLELTLERWKIVKAYRHVTGWIAEPLRIAKVVTLVYLLVLVLISLAIDTCEGSEAVRDTDWLARQFSCMSHNELGDYLAGASAPLAFLWLVVAVFIQSKELAAQREELKLTRSEYSQTREEMKASTNQLKAQTNLLRDDLNRKGQEIADKSLHELLVKISAKIDNCQIGIVLDYPDKSDEQKGYMGFTNVEKIRFINPELPDQFNPDIDSIEILKLKDYVNSKIDSSKGKIISWRIDDYEHSMRQCLEMQTLLHDAKQKLNYASEPVRIKYMQLSLEKATIELDTFFRELRQYSDEQVLVGR